ncbi:hypothetical protein BTE77_06655 [Ensifer adhaerens]|nr:hypothetical protein BTE77_06655 [Ensifer adhaerens]
MALCGKPTVEIVAHGLTIEEASRIEIALIESIGLAKLTNISPGGSTHTEESRRKVGEASKGRRHSEESKRKIGDASRGDKNPNYGKPLSDEMRQRISATLKGRSLPNETRRKISESLKGITRSEETRRKIGDAHRGANSPLYGKPLSDDHRKKLSDALSGKPKKEEHKRKLRDGRLGENNPNADVSSYIFTHAVHGTIHCTRHELRAKYSLQSYGISKLVLGKLPSYHGWRIFSAANANTADGMERANG